MKFYESIEDMPIYNWFKVNNGDMRFMLIKQTAKYDGKKAREYFDKIYSEYIDVFGISESYLKVIELKKQISVLNIEMAITGDRILKNFIKMAQVELNQINSKTNKTNTNEVKVHLEKYLGFRLNEKETSVKEYYTYLNVMANDSRKAA
ncbi:MAG: hypothetical protein IPG89_22150 [Bacteroidetes bacterium]|nr:hypothetical protein [Bacteroidota bacterium]